MAAVFVLYILPFLAMAACYLIRREKPRFVLSLGVAAVHLAFSVAVFFESDVLGIKAGEYDALSRYFLLIISNVYFWTMLVSGSFLKNTHLKSSASGIKYFYFFLNLFLLANGAAVMSKSFIIYWVAAEATTLSVAPLIFFYRDRDSLEAMWKYLFLVSVGIAFTFIGILFLAISAHNTILEGRQLYFDEFVKNAALLNPVWLKAAFVFIFVGLSTKIGIAPMHQADVDATSNSPSPIAALMSGSLRITALLGLLRFVQITNSSSIAGFVKTSLIAGGLISLVVVMIMMFKVKNYKRLLAYSSVEHLGIIVIGIGTGGLAFTGAMYHALYNSIIKVILFLNAGLIHQKFKSREIKNVHSVINLMPLTGWIFFAAFLAISAIPPFGIFFSELMIFEGIFKTGKPWLLASVLAFMFVIFIKMSLHILHMLHHEPDEKNILPPQKEEFNIIHLVSLLLLALSVGAALLLPQSFREIITRIAFDFGVAP